MRTITLAPTICTSGTTRGLSGPVAGSVSSYLASRTSQTSSLPTALRRTGSGTSAAFTAPAGGVDTWRRPDWSPSRSLIAYPTVGETGSNGMRCAMRIADSLATRQRCSARMPASCLASQEWLRDARAEASPHCVSTASSYPRRRQSRRAPRCLPSDRCTSADQRRQTAARTIAVNSSASRLAPPTSDPSMSGCAASSAALAALTEPP